MEPFSFVLGVRLAGLAGLAVQSALPAPAIVVQLDPAASEVETIVGQPQRPMLAHASATDLRRAGQLQPLPVTRLDDATATAVLDAPRRLALRFTAPQPIRQVLMMLVRDTGLTLVVSADANGTFAGELAGVTLRQALDLVLRPLALDYSLEGNAIRVFRRETITRILDVNAIAARQRQVSGDTFDDLAKSLTSLLSPVGRVGLDRKAGLVHVTDYPEDADRVAAYLESIQLRLNRQVSIQARVLELSLPEAASPTVDWSRVIGQAQTGTGRDSSIDYDRLIATLRQHGTVNVLTTTEVRVLHNEQAIIRVGVHAQVFEGFTLAVTPHIGADGSILLTVAPAVAEPFTARGASGASSPMLVTSEVDTAVRVRDGETLVLPGIRRGDTEIAVLLTTKVI